MDVLVGKGIIGHDPASRGADGNGFRFTLVGAPVRSSCHDGTGSPKTSLIDESTGRDLRVLSHTVAVETLHSHSNGYVPGGGEIAAIRSQAAYGLSTLEPASTSSRSRSEPNRKARAEPSSLSPSTAAAAPPPRSSPISAQSSDRSSPSSAPGSTVSSLQSVQPSSPSESTGANTANSEPVSNAPAAPGCSTAKTATASRAQVPSLSASSSVEGRAVQATIAELSLPSQSDQPGRSSVAAESS